MRRKLILLFVLVLSCFNSLPNNLKITTLVTIEPIVDDANAVNLKFNITWENSWRNNENWDAAWVFLKYCQQDGEWKHVNLSATGHSTNNSGEISIGKTDGKGIGVFVYRNAIGVGDNNFDVSLKWNLSDNGLTQADLPNVNLEAFGIEMVYVPEGAFYLGDGVSKETFKSPTGMPDAENVVNNTSGYSFYGNKTVYGSGPEKAAMKYERNSNTSYTNYSSVNGGWPVYFHVWQVDFKAPKTIYWFGVAGYFDLGGIYQPIGEWKFQGSNNSSTWDDLWVETGGFSNSGVSYPIQNAIKVQHPDQYRYYRIYTQTCKGNFMVLYNVGMSENPNMIEDEIVIRNENIITLQQGTVPANYPKGFRAFYCMKYEVTQEQYVDFLNKLNLVQQNLRVTLDIKYALSGTLINTNPVRNGISIYYPADFAGGRPALFGVDLNNDGSFFGLKDGCGIACNYLSRYDSYAYAYWAGLRPMSELEYEKAARGSEPLVQRGNAFNGDVVSLSGLDGNTVGTETESPANVDANVNSGGEFSGPVRVGIFANSNSGRIKSGASFWGILDLSGNLKERCVSVTADKFVDVHGNGVLSDANVAMSTWPYTGQNNALRGGSYSSTLEFLSVSDRSLGNSNDNIRTSDVGFRAVRTAP